ncbi:DUF3572 domain-containing protein [Sandaracinobacter sp. RS1-74]|uniref:DUF3572 family protein n=1 Tax=Sandaracinobacteroides sayramensis TaxID=2913411 RepID=UPI001EDAE6AC|nr:DUF3572 family protein [Sandaracinobacteroides sayramensis]MCG2840602.1 DUF3572 domain-containing protein [Sandaracinobacteroides sayramensis]
MDSTLALQALAAIIAEDDLRDRFLALTGYDGDTIRARAGSADMAQAVADFLGGHEPDLMRVAAQLGVPPEKLLGRRP